MIRIKNLEKYKKKSQHELDLKYMRDDDNYILDSHRPIKEEKINELSSVDLHNFVDDVLSSRSINKVLFSSNSRAEINLLIKSTEFTKSSLGNLKKSYNPKYDPTDIVKNRNKKETVAQINEEINNEKLEKIQVKEFLENKMDDFYRMIHNEMKVKMNMEKSEQIVSKDRKKKFDKTFSFIKKKLITLHDEDKKKKFLPDMKLHIENVFSRLYHNVVLPKAKKEESTNTNTNFHRAPSNVAQSLELQPQSKTSAKKLSVRNIFNTFSGKEFTVKITDEIIAECYFRHSGGPLIKTDTKNVKFYN
jgi:hypothetical protein